MTACYINNGGVSTAGTWAYNPATLNTVAAGSTVSGTCTLTGGVTNAAGSQAGGSLAISN